MENIQLLNYEQAVSNFSAVIGSQYQLNSMYDPVNWLNFLLLAKATPYNQRYIQTLFANYHNPLLLHREVALIKGTVAKVTFQHLGTLPKTDEYPLLEPFIEEYAAWSRFMRYARSAIAQNTSQYLREQDWSVDTITKSYIEILEEMRIDPFTSMEKNKKMAMSLFGFALLPEPITQLIHPTKLGGIIIPQRPPTAIEKEMVQAHNLAVGLTTINSM